LVKLLSIKLSFFCDLGIKELNSKIFDHDLRAAPQPCSMDPKSVYTADLGRTTDMTEGPEVYRSSFDFVGEGSFAPFS